MLTQLTTLASRLGALFTGRRQDREFDAEVADHLDRLTGDFIRRGLEPGEARRQAILRFGGPVQIKEHQRHHRGLPFVEMTLQDVRYALRSFGRSPGFTALAVLTLGLAIGVNTTVFTLFDSVALRGLPVRDPDSLVRLGRSFQGGARGDLQYAFSYAEYAAYLEQSRSLTDVIAVSWPIRVAFSGEGLDGQLVSGTYFTALGIHAATGRTLLADDAAASAPVIVLSDAGWRLRFHADPDVAGRSVRLNDTLFTIVGVAPAGFIGTGNPPQVPDFWAPLTLQPQLVPGSEWLHANRVRAFQLLARLTPGTSRRSAQPELTQLVARIDTESGNQRTIGVEAGHATIFGGTTDARFLAFVALVMAVVGMVLLIACANLSNMLLARGASRQREFAVRLALGAGRARLVRQLLTESLLLAVGGGSAGIVFSLWGCAWLWSTAAETVQGMFRSDVPWLVPLGPDARVFGHTLAMSMAAGVAFGLWPALRFSSHDLTVGLKDDARAFGKPASGSSLRSWLIAGQVAASLALLAGAGLLARGAARSQNVDPGFPVKNTFAVVFNRGTDADRARRLDRQVLDRLHALTELAGVGYAQRIPLRNTWTTPVMDADAPESTAFSLANYVSPGFFDTMGIAIARGRTFTVAEQESPAGVVIVSQATAQHFWPLADPIGRRLQVSTSQGRTPEFHAFTVVGVARDVHTGNASRTDPLFVYLPARSGDRHEILIRTGEARGAALDAVRAAVGSLDRNLLPSLQFVSLDALLRDQQRLTGTLATVATTLAVLALALAAIGIYGVMSFLVAQRVHEIGVRLALGARRRDVARLMLVDGLRPVVVGGVAGLILALAISLVARATLVAPSSPDLLFGVGALDPATFLAVCSVLGVTALLACLAPTVRAMRVDPMTALRAE